jgi:type IV fimbrial biogenesis protein FimT
MPQRNAAGTSLTELLVSLGIVSALATIAIPAVTSLYWQMELSSATNRLYNLVQLARHNALTQQTRVSVCPLSTSGDCSKIWKGNISAFTDTNGNRNFDEGDTLLNTYELPEPIKIIWRGMGSGNNLHFNRQGITFVSNGTFTLTHREKTMQLIISRLGKPKVLAAK